MKVRPIQSSQQLNFESKQYTWALFIGHLTLEKLLKAIYARKNESSPYPPKIHNLNILAERCGLEVSEEYTKILYAQGRLIEGLSIDNPTELSNLICKELSKDQK